MKRSLNPVTVMTAMLLLTAFASTSFAEEKVNMNDPNMNLERYEVGETAATSLDCGPCHLKQVAQTRLLGHTNPRPSGGKPVPVVNPDEGSQQ